jgi:serine/threonine protein kinase
VSGMLHSAGDIVGGRYAIQGFIGQGGMQEVYLANDLLLNRHIALKVPKSTSAKKRFKRSAVLSAKVNHNNVAKTLDYLEEAGKYYLIEEFIKGCDLGAFMRDHVSSFDPFAAARVLHHLAKGLAASHHAKVVHRDLKPTNVMVEGAAAFVEFKITDFGIAKMAAEEIEEAASSDVEGLTTSQTALGALPYMAPETIDDIKAVGKPADVWAVGALAFEMLTGRRPFGQGYKAVPLIQAAKLPELPASVTAKAQFRPFSEALYKVIKACVVKDPGSRPTADQLVAACEALHYSDAQRYFGTIDSIKGAFGFIRRRGSEPTFFHRSSVFPGGTIEVGQRVWFSSYPGSPRKRAFPVVVAVQPEA